MPTARATPNIALIKYWGNSPHGNEWRLPAADSCSMTLDSPFVDVTVEHSDHFSVTSANKEMKEKDIARFQKTMELIDKYLNQIFHFPSSIFNPITISISSHIPPSIGLASSSAVFAAFAKGVAGLIEQTADSMPALNDEQISIMARLGSGSAARSIFGGFVALTNNRQQETENSIDAMIARQIAPTSHWPLHDIIIVPSTEEKKVSSTEGHAGAHTSPHFADRIRSIQNRRQQECIDAILKKDFEKLQAVSEEDCLDMHRCMQTQTPPLHYLSEETYRIIEEIKSLRESKHLPVLFTMDAGPTVHLLCLPEAVREVTAFAHAQKECRVFETITGKGAHLL